jgi:sugar phosphate isomerase/epimerase
MEFGLSTYLFVGERLTSHQLDQIAHAGIRTIEIFAARQHFDYQDKNQVRDVAQWFDDHGLKLHSLHAPLYADFDWGRSGSAPISITHLQRAKRIESMEEIKRAIEVAEILPFHYLVLHVGVASEEYDIAKFDAAMTSIEHLKIFAKERGAQILLENIPNEVSTPERLLHFIQYSRMGDLKFCFDTGHAHMAGGVAPSFQVMRERIASTHVHDNQREKDNHLFPFEGDIDWNATVHDFRRVEGQFPVLFELHDPGKETPALDRVRQVIHRFEEIR